LILAIDQGTTGTTCIVFDESGRPAGRAYREFRQHFPRPGWVEHDAAEIWDVTRSVAREALDAAGAKGGELDGIGITNQRETVVAWDRETGEPLHRAIVWQDRRTARRCDELREAGHEPLVRERTGLVLDPYFSGTKIEWLLREGDVPPDAAFGTIDSWLVFKLTGQHATDFSNASRTLLFDIRERRWDPELCDLLGVDPGSLPEPRPSAHVYGETSEFGGSVPVAGIAGDQQAALYGQACHEPGLGKNTYGTGSFVLENAGADMPEPAEGLLTTVAWGVGERVDYALEAAIFVTGAAVQWLRDQLGIIRTADEIEPLASSVDDNGGAYVVPAFSGLFAPYWRADARGVITGLTRYVTKEHLARAVLEATSWQTREVVDAMYQDSGVQITTLKVDGGMTKNNLLMQHQADVLGVPVIRPRVSETTCLGAAYAAGLATGVWNDLDELKRHWQKDAEWTPAMATQVRDREYDNWRKAVEKSFGWHEDSAG
jgi:glycerol kinase